jgi:hypothetical protein
MRAKPRATSRGSGRILARALLDFSAPAHSYDGFDYELAHLKRSWDFVI